jgi:hypothetical protein
MPRKEHPEYGPVNERTLPASTLDDGLRASLEDFKKRGLIRHYSMEGEKLTLLRPWIEGQTQEEFFRGLTGGDRITYSHQLFRSVERKLGELGVGHGALHPRNIILRQVILRPGDVVELVDAVFNRVRMEPLSASQDNPWLWGPGVPKGWSLEDWDRVSLLRTAALLAGGSSVWRPLLVADAVEICQRWALEFIGSETSSGADFVASVRKAVALLPRIVESSRFPLEEKLAALAARQGADRMLRRKEEEELAGLAAQFGLGRDQIGRRLRTWMVLSHYRQESELRSLAAELLKAGLYRDTVLVSARACAAAERTFTHYGVDPKEAAGLVQQLLAQAKCLDERRAAQECSRFLAGHLKAATEPPDDDKAEELAAEFAEASGFPPDVARRLVDLEFERRLLGLTH